MTKKAALAGPAVSGMARASTTPASEVKIQLLAEDTDVLVHTHLAMYHPATPEKAGDFGYRSAATCCWNGLSGAEVSTDTHDGVRGGSYGGLDLGTGDAEVREGSMGQGALGAAGQCRSGQHGRGAVTAALVVLATLCLGACGTEVTATGATGGTTTAPSPSVRSPYVEPGAGDGAPHYRENNGFRISGAMSAASAKDAQREADRIEPVLKRLWQQRAWDPKTVRAAMLKLGYQEERFDAKGNLLGGTLRVEPMDSRFENGREITPEGALVGLRVHDDACVTAFVQKTNYQVSTNGPYPETGCFEPPAGH